MFGRGDADALLDRLTNYERLSAYAAVRQRLWAKKVHLPLEEHSNRRLAPVPIDDTIRQSFPEFGHARIRDSSVVKIKPLQTRQPLQVDQPRIRDLRAAEIKRLQTRQPLEVGQPSVCDLPAAKMKPSQVRQPLQVVQPRICDLGAVKPKRL